MALNVPKRGGAECVPERGGAVGPSIVPQGVVTPSVPRSVGAKCVPKRGGAVGY